MKEKRKIEEILKIVITLIAIIILAVIVLLNGRYEVTISRYEEHTEIQEMGIIKLLFCFAISIGVIGGINKINQCKFANKLKMIVIILAIFGYIVFQVIWIEHCILKPGADSEMIYGTALRFFHNEGVSERMLEYFSYYKQNIGLTVIFEGIMKLLQNDSLNIFRYLNVIANVSIIGGLYVIYKNSIKNKKEKNEWLLFFLLLGFLPISLLSTWVYGDFIGLGFSIWSIAFIIKYVQDKKIQNFIFSCISMAFAIMTRSNSLIFIIAIVIYLLFTLSKEKTRKEKIIRWINVVLFIIISILPNKLLENYISNKYQLNNRKEKSTITYLYMGMSEGGLANGWYNNEIGMINETMMKQEKNDRTVENETKEKLKERMKYLIKHPSYTLKFYKDKILSMWAEPTMASEVYNTQRNIDTSTNKVFVLLMEGKRFEILKLSQKIIDGMIYTGALICVILKRKNISNEMLLLVLVFLGGFSFHLLWEAKSRYVIPYIVILIPVAVEGINEGIKWIKNKKKLKKLLLKKGEEQNEKDITSSSHVL